MPHFHSISHFFQGSVVDGGSGIPIIGQQGEWRRVLWKLKTSTPLFSLAQVTSLELLNTLEEKSLLLTASRDGCIRVWRNYEGKYGATPVLLTAW